MRFSQCIHKQCDVGKKIKEVANIGNLTMGVITFPKYSFSFWLLRINQCLPRLGPYSQLRSNSFSTTISASNSAELVDGLAFSERNQVIYVRVRQLTPKHPKPHFPHYTAFLLDYKWQRCRNYSNFTVNNAFQIIFNIKKEFTIWYKRQKSLKTSTWGEVWSQSMGCQ